MTDADLNEIAQAEQAQDESEYVSNRPANSSVADGGDGHLYYYEITDGKLADVVRIGCGPIEREEMTQALSQGIVADATKLGLL